MQKLNIKTISNSEIILQKVCQLTNFSYGEIWLPNDENNFLELSSDYYIVADRDRQNLEIFHECSQGFIMTKGEGLPGRVFLCKKPEWMLDVSVESEGSFLRNKIAGVCGVKTGFAIPVIKKNKVLMVMTFFSPTVRSYSPKCLALAMDIVINFSVPIASLDKH